MALKVRTVAPICFHGLRVNEESVATNLRNDYLAYAKEYTCEKEVKNQLNWKCRNLLAKEQNCFVAEIFTVSDFGVVRHNSIQNFVSSILFLRNYNSQALMSDY